MNTWFILKNKERRYLRNIDDQMMLTSGAASNLSWTSIGSSTPIQVLTVDLAVKKRLFQKLGSLGTV